MKEGLAWELGAIVGSSRTSFEDEPLEGRFLSVLVRSGGVQIGGVSSFSWVLTACALL